MCAADSARMTDTSSTSIARPPMNERIPLLQTQFSSDLDGGRTREQRLAGGQRLPLSPFSGCVVYATVLSLRPVIPRLRTADELDSSLQLLAFLRELRLCGHSWVRSSDGAEGPSPSSTYAGRFLLGCQRRRQGSWSHADLKMVISTLRLAAVRQRWC